jgi:hypothetical protein
VSLLKRDDHKSLIITEAIKKHASPSENNTKAHVSAVQKTTGLDAIYQAGALSDKEFGALTEAIRIREG